MRQGERERDIRVKRIGKESKDEPGVKSVFEEEEEEGRRGVACEAEALGSTLIPRTTLA